MNIEKHVWHKIIADRNCREPTPRWGHAAVRVQHQIVFFGGYADTNYMNDLWSFDTTTMLWEEHKTTGTIPSQRSNCTLHYNQNDNSLILIGGGGSNKKRFNSISCLDWKTKQWTEYMPLQNEKAPWERTYHSSALMYPYLIMFGGQGIADLDDLWVFNLQTHKWTQISTPKNQAKPCGRRFHTSVILNNQFYVIAGCHGKYRCLSDIWKIDLTSFFQTGTTDQLEWEDLKIKGTSFLTRWGHTSAVFNQKIYIFAGRFSNDLQDILVIDLENVTIKTLKVSGEIPKARRRHSAVFVGSSMVVFGGFNGEYYNDMSYINVFDSKARQPSENASSELQLVRWVGKQVMSDAKIISTSGSSVPIHKGLLVSKFKSQYQLQAFLQFLDHKYSEDQLLQIVQILYLGAGRLPEELTDSFEIHLYDTLTDKNNQLRKLIDPDLADLASLVGTKKTNQVISLDQEKYAAYLERYNQQQYYDLIIEFGEESLPANKTELAVSSQYFQYMLSNHQGDYLQIQNHQEFGDHRVMQVLLNYLQSGYLVVPQGLDERCWILLYYIAEYLCVSSLMNQCQNQLISLLTFDNCQAILSYSSKCDISRLATHSGQLLFKKMLDQGKKQYLFSLKDHKCKNSSEDILSGLMNLLEFDIRQQDRREGETRVQVGKKKNFNNAEKENEIEYGQE